MTKKKKIDSSIHKVVRALHQEISACGASCGHEMSEEKIQELIWSAMCELLPDIITARLYEHFGMTSAAKPEAEE